MRVDESPARRLDDFGVFDSQWAAHAAVLALKALAAVRRVWILALAADRASRVVGVHSRLSSSIAGTPASGAVMAFPTMGAVVVGR